MNTEGNDRNLETRKARVQALAREIWEAEGRPEGKALRHWTMAERLVEAEERSRHGDHDPSDRGDGAATS